MELDQPNRHKNATTKANIYHIDRLSIGGGAIVLIAYFLVAALLKPTVDICRVGECELLSAPC